MAIRHILSLLFIAFMLSASVVSASSLLDLADIIAHPDQYDRQEVVVSGQVTNVQLATRDGSLGWPEHAPFDAIVVAAAAREVPPALVDQLADAGRLIVPVGGEQFQTLRLVERRGADVSTEDLVHVRFVPLVVGSRQ